jgi:hypothetical protein
MPQRTIPSRQYTAGQVVSRTFNDLERFGRVGIEVNVSTWPQGVPVLTLTITLSNGQAISTTIDGTPPKGGGSYKGFELTVTDPDAFDRVDVEAAFQATVTTDFRIWGERNLGVTSLGRK